MAGSAPWKHHRNKARQGGKEMQGRETPQGPGEAKKEGGAGQVMFPGWLDQLPWKHHRDKARQRRKERQGK